MAKKGNRCIRVFLDTHMGLNHIGLKALAKENKVDLDSLAEGEMVIFINKARTAFKIFAPGNVFAYKRMPGEARLDMRVIEELPRYFGGGKLNYEAALKEVITKALEKKSK